MVLAPLDELVVVVDAVVDFVLFDAVDPELDEQAVSTAHAATAAMSKRELFNV